MAGVWGMGFCLPAVRSNGNPAVVSERHALTRGPDRRQLLPLVIHSLIFLSFSAESRVLWPPRRDICKVRRCN